MRNEDHIEWDVFYSEISVRKENEKLKELIAMEDKLLDKESQLEDKERFLSSQNEYLKLLSNKVILNTKQVNKPYKSVSPLLQYSILNKFSQKNSSYFLIGLKK